MKRPHRNTRPSAPLERYLPLLRQLWRERGRAGRGPRSGERFSDTELYEAAHAVRDLSRGFTRDRGLAGAPYMEDPRLLGAYLLFYWPISYAQTWAAALSAGIVPARAGFTAETRILDLGSGPGAASFALQDIGFRNVTAADRSAAALALLKEISGRLARQTGTRHVDLVDPAAADRLRPAGPFDLIVTMHTLNELWAGRAERIPLRAALARRLAGLLAPGGRLLLVEPALTATANDAILLRDELAAAGWVVESPCTFAGRCPALPRGTCHAEVEWEPPRDLVRLAHAARIGREALAFPFFLLAPPGPHGKATVGSSSEAGRPAGLYRVVSERFLAKSGRLRVLICGPEGRFALSVDGRAAFEAARVFRGLRRYDLVRVDGAEKRETGYGLVPESALRIVERAPSLA